MIIPAGDRPNERQRRQEEARLQAQCYQWCWNEHPQTRRLLFHVENERSDGNKVDGARRVAMGLVAGVSDLILLMPRGEYHGLCIEMKTLVGKQRENQRTWQVLVESQGYKYCLCRSLAQFQEIITEYLSLPIKK